MFYAFYFHFPSFELHLSSCQILDSSKLKEVADDNFKFDKNGRKLSGQVEKTVGKGEIARYEQFLLFPQCFQKACFPGASKEVIVWEWVIQILPFTIQSQLLMTLRKEAFENIFGKAENAGNQHFLLFPKCFLPYLKQISIYESHSFCRLQFGKS